MSTVASISAKPANQASYHNRPKKEVTSRAKVTDIESAPAHPSLGMHLRYCANNCQRATNVTLILELATDSSQGQWGMRHVAGHSLRTTVNWRCRASTSLPHTALRSAFALSRPGASDYSSPSIPRDAGHQRTHRRQCSSQNRRQRRTTGRQVRHRVRRRDPRRILDEQVDVVVLAVASDLAGQPELESALKIGDVGREPGKTLTDEFEFPIGRRTRRWRSRRRRAGRRHHFGWRR